MKINYLSGLLQYFILNNQFLNNQNTSHLIFKHIYNKLSSV